MRYFFRREVEHDARAVPGAGPRPAGEPRRERSRPASPTWPRRSTRHAEQLESLLADVHVRRRPDCAATCWTSRRSWPARASRCRSWAQAVLEACPAAPTGERASCTASDSLSIRDEDERRLVKDLVRRYRALPADQRKQMPALLNAVGKLEVVAGDFESAERDFRELADDRPGDPGPRRRRPTTPTAPRWSGGRGRGAGGAQRGGDARRRDRFAPFPVGKYEAEKILGAGGFGVAFLCRNRHSGAQVVVKTLRRDGLDRDLDEVFREAQALEAAGAPRHHPRARLRLRRRRAAPGRTWSWTTSRARPRGVRRAERPAARRASCCRWRGWSPRACSGARQGHPAPRREAGQPAGAATDGRERLAR